mmetsp:Transcript_29955/g.96119  ORF Transcript_29955/g.96119 Transcript_29955/m.96119 type:complete len:231 (-) Transcript_29955:434-1126(-)
MLSVLFASRAYCTRASAAPCSPNPPLILALTSVATRSALTTSHTPSEARTRNSSSGLRPSSVTSGVGTTTGFCIVARFASLTPASRSSSSRSKREDLKSMSPNARVTARIPQTLPSLTQPPAFLIRLVSLLQTLEFPSTLWSSVSSTVCPPRAIMALESPTLATMMVSFRRSTVVAVDPLKQSGSSSSQRYRSSLLSAFLKALVIRGARDRGHTSPSGSGRYGATSTRSS